MKRRVTIQGSAFSEFRRNVSMNGVAPPLMYPQMWELPQNPDLGPLSRDLPA
jgi:hypothetical protein